jgi:spermidine/putrescine transport system ATP-binding protein
VVVDASRSGEGFVPGGPATVMLRPERLRLGVHEPEGERLKVRVTDLIFQGPQIRTVVSSADGTELVAHVGAGDDLPMLRPGQELWLSWDAGAAYALPEATDIVGATDTDIDEVEASL